MKKLWGYQDYVKHLSHPNALVRRRAFEALDTQYSRVYTKEVASLLSDSREYTASAAARYLARHGALETAPLILDQFINGEGVVPGNCLLALGDMGFAQALDEVIQTLPYRRDFHTILAGLHYFSKIRNDDSHGALLELFQQLQDDSIKGPVAANLLLHRRPGDVPMVLDYFFEEGLLEEAENNDLGALLRSPAADSLFDDLMEHRRLSILKSPQKSFGDLLDCNPALAGAEEQLDRICELINESRYQDLSATLLAKARELFQARFPGSQPEDFHREVFEKDMMALAFLEYFSNRSSCRQSAQKDETLAGISLSAVLACFLSIHEREALLEALAPDAPVEALIRALKLAGADFPKVLQDRIVEIAPVEALKNLLTEDLNTWGDIWTVRLMERIGDKAFLPELARVLRDADYMAVIYSKAVFALEKLDESAHPQVLEAIRNGEIGDSLNALSLLGHLPYSEAFDLARKVWEKEEEGEFELYASCLEGIGDERGIEVLQNLMTPQNIDFIGDSLEVLAAVHERDIPELSRIMRRREKAEERRWKRALDLDGPNWGYQEGKAWEDDLAPAPEPFQRDKPKIGRNAPCPCGSGKKYKKCCLDKDG